MPTHGETVLTFSFRRSIGDESHGRVSWGKLYVRGAVVISRALLLRGPASSGWNVQAGVSSLRFVVICWNDNWRSEKHSRARCIIGKNFTYTIFISQGVIEGNRGNV